MRVQHVCQYFFCPLKESLVRQRLRWWLSLRRRKSNLLSCKYSTLGMSFSAIESCLCSQQWNDSWEKFVEKKFLARRLYWGHTITSILITWINLDYIPGLTSHSSQFPYLSDHRTLHLERPLKSTWSMWAEVRQCCRIFRGSMADYFQCSISTGNVNYHCLVSLKLLMPMHWAWSAACILFLLRKLVVLRRNLSIWLTKLKSSLD